MAESWKERASRVLQSTYGPPAATLVRGEGCRVYDDRNTPYLDLLGGIAVSCLGHCHPAVVAAIREQCATLMHVSNLYVHPPQVRLAELLVERFPESRVFFCNSGAEANEAAIKLARRLSFDRHGPGSHVIVAARGSFHGRTMGALSATGQEKYHQGFEPMLPGFRHVPFNDLAALEEGCDDTVAAVLLEPIQGEGGVVMPHPGYLQGVQELCRRRSLLFMLDEVQTGMGRTGTFFAFEEEGVRPDVVTLSKALGGGLALGAMLARGEAAGALTPGSHATTFGGNPVACAAAAALIETIDAERLLERVREMGEFLRNALWGLSRREPKVAGVRGRGLLVGIELSVAAAPLVSAALERGYLINAVQEKVIRLAPPFIIDRTDLAAFLGDLEVILQEADTEA